MESSTPRREKRRTLMSAFGIVLAVMVLAPPIVYAAAQKVNIVKSIPLPLKAGTKVAVTNLKGTTTVTQDHGSLADEVTPKGVNTNNLAGGEGYWGTAICAAGDSDPDVDAPTDNQVIVPAAEGTSRTENVIASIIVGSPNAALITVKAPVLSSEPLIRYRTTDTVPSQAIELPTGLRVSPSPVVITCESGGNPTTGETRATVVVLGH